MGNIKARYFGAPRRIAVNISVCGQGAAHFLHKQQETAESYFVPRRTQKFFNLPQSHGAIRFPRHGANRRHSYAEKLVALAIFSLAGFEKTHQYAALRLVAHAEHGFGNVVSRCHFSFN